MNEVTFEVEGLPPLKSETLSLFNIKHGQMPRVRTLLEAAQRAIQEKGFTPITDGLLALDVVVRSPGRGDATNALGGIADVLEDKRDHRHRKEAVAWLAELGATWLYRNDKQIDQISYRTEPGAVCRYTVTVREL